MPAKAGVQGSSTRRLGSLDSRLRGNDGLKHCALGNPGTSPPAEFAAAVLLWLDHPRLSLLCRLLTAGAGRRHVVDFCRTVDARVRLDALGPSGGRISGRCATSRTRASTVRQKSTTWR